MGALVFAMPYAGSVGLSAASNYAGKSKLFVISVVGPIIFAGRWFAHIAEVGVSYGLVGYGAVGLIGAVPIVVGIAEFAGLGAMIIGFVKPKRTLQRSGVQLSIVPLSNHKTPGLSLVGTF